MKVTVIPIIVGALEIVYKNLEKRLDKLKIRGRLENTQTTAVLKSTRILKIILKTRGDLLPFRFWKKPSVKTGVKKSQGVFYIYIYINFLNSWESLLLFTKLCLLCMVAVWVYPTPTQWAGCNARSIFKQSTTGLNSEFSFS